MAELEIGVDGQDDKRVPMRNRCLIIKGRVRIPELYRTRITTLAELPTPKVPDPGMPAQPFQPDVDCTEIQESEKAGNQVRPL